MTTRVLIVALLCLFAAGCRSSQPSTVRFGYKATPGQLLGVVAVKEGFFAQEGLQIDEVILPTGQQILEAATAGKVDVGLASSAAVIAAYSAGAPIRVIAGSSYGGGRKRLLVLHDAPYRDIGDLVGKTIAVASGGVAMKEFLRSLEAAGRSASAFNALQRYTDADLGPLLISRAVDAIVCAEPLCSKLEYTKVARELADFRSVALDPNSLFVSVSFLESRPQAVSRVLRAWLAAERHVGRDRAKALKLLSVESGEDLPVIALACQRIIYGAAMPEMLLKEYQTDADFLAAEGKVRSSDLGQLFRLGELKRLVDENHADTKP